MQSDILQLEREAIANSTYQPLHHAAILMKQRDQDPSDLLDRVLQMSDGNMFLTVRDEFPEYIDGVATRLAVKASELMAREGPGFYRDCMYRHIAGSLALHNPALARQNANKIKNIHRLERTYRDMVVKLTPQNFKLAIEIANKITDQQWREESYSHIAGTLAQLNPSLAKKFIEPYIDPSRREGSYELIKDSMSNKILNSQIDHRFAPLVRSAKFEELESLFRTEPYERVVDYCQVIGGLTQDAI